MSVVLNHPITRLERFQVSANLLSALNKLFIILGFQPGKQNNTSTVVQLTYVFPWLKTIHYLLESNIVFFFTMNTASMNSSNKLNQTNNETI